MNKSSGVSFLNRNRILCFSALAATALLASGCGEKPFLKVNGQIITKDEYISALEQTLAVAGPSGTVPVPAGRLVLEQLIGRKIILAEANTQGVVPSDDDVNKAFRYRKDMLEQGQPGKSFEDELQKQGTTAEAFKENLRAELAEVAVLVKKLGVGDDKVRAYYTEHREEFGLPARVQLRLILVGPNTPQFADAQKKLADPKNFTEKTARDLNIIPQLKQTGGLQVLATSALPPNVAPKIQQAAVGTVIGPVDWALQGGAAKAWIKVEKKLPQYNVPVEEAAPVARQRVILQLQSTNDPKFNQIRSEIIQKKFAATVESTSPVHETIWKSVKKSAQDAGLDKAPAPAPGAVNGVPPAAPSAPGKGVPTPEPSAPGKGVPTPEPSVPGKGVPKPGAAVPK
ncbi:SurA N-terminal domain-containing protein [Armatimonas sp.]|uniref:peptidylprolyl isomerase n=1 Tax=Armatimonas sp. TaxID=1872638 RepID=UPI00374C9307